MNNNILWIDRVKIFACISVVISHLISGIVDAGIVKTNFVFSWIEFYLYLFHVPLFFICSGYLYQRYSSITNFIDIKKNIIKKFINLSIPYFVFSMLTILLKSIFSGVVNNVEKDILKILFITPTAPYWYLYVLFFFFTVTFTINNRRQEYFALGVAIIMKIIISILFDLQLDIIKIDIIVKFMVFYIWFILGMIIANNKIIEDFLRNINIYIVLSMMILITFCSAILLDKGYTYEINRFLLGLFLALLTCSTFMKIDIKFFKRIAKYIMPIFLMHTICAAGMRSLLLYLGIYNLGIHVILGFISSIAIPVVIAYMFEKSIYLNILLYPLKTIKDIKQKNRRIIHEYK